MSNFYLKIKNFENEIEFSTDDEKMFKEKVEQLLVEFSNLSLPKTENSCSIPKENTDLANFVEIKPNDDNINQLQENEDNNMVMEFEKILDKSKEEPTVNFVEPEYNNVEFQSYIISFNPQNQMDYFIYSARYLAKYCNQQNFTLKQINSKLVPVCNMAVPHKIISEALEKGWITVIPDCTQTSLNKEYCLTQRGEYEYPNE